MLEEDNTTIEERECPEEESRVNPSKSSIYDVISGNESIKVDVSVDTVSILLVVVGVILAGIVIVLFRKKMINK